MAPSVAPPIKQSYSAGNCRLDLTLQPSALSQWHPRLIVEQVQFKLWMSEAQGAEPALLAEGDRTTLQAIAHHIEQRTQAVLTINRTSSPAAPTLPQLPEKTHLPHPLSYLQLCDLSTVLTQCERAAKTLPVSLPIAPSTASETDRPTAALGQEVTSPPTQSAAVPKQKGKLIFFPTGRRAAWASSAAAALFAVGLTTVLWNDKTSVPETVSIAEADLAEPNITESENPRLRLRKPADEELSAALADSASQSERNRAQTAQRSRSTTQRTAKPTNVPGRSNSSTTVSPENPTASKSTSSPESARAESGLNGSDSSQGPRQSNESADVPAPINRQTPNNAPDRKIANAEPDAEALNPAALSAPTAETDDGLPTLEPSSPLASARRGQNSEVNRASAPLSPANAEESAFSPAAISRQESETITQVQNYFVNQWRPDENLSAPLSYQLQLSSSGEVVSFSALTEGGGAYRDRLLPDSKLSFPPSNSVALANGLTLKIVLTPNGQVQVEKM